MIAEGKRLAKIHKNVVVKVPMIAEGIKAVGALSREGIRTNVTLCFSAAQALVAAKAGAYIISPFVGRVDDIGWPGIELIDNIMKIYGNYNYKTQVLAASVRGPLHVIEIAKSGVHIVTLTYKVLEQLFHHPLTEKGLEQFLSDHRKAFETANV
jgi:transaldolase